VQTLTRLALFALIFLASAVLPHGGARAQCATGEFPVAVDIGHTADDPGAMSARGIPEFIFNMALGRDVEKALADAGFPARRIIVSGKGKQQLSRRVAAAAAFSPAVVISIHHDSVQETYLKDWRFAGVPRRYSDRFSGFSIFVSRANPQFDESLALARELGRTLIAAGLRFSSHHAERIAGESRETLDGEAGVFEFRNLRVLKQAAAPAILFEAGIIVNREEEIELASPARRQLAAAAIVEAVTAICARRSTTVVLR
jgi:N-acetylmuramoyl-L-alanine amidase